MITKVVFKINDVVVLKSNPDLSLIDIVEQKKKLASFFEVGCEDIEVELVNDINHDLSIIDVCELGLYYFDSLCIEDEILNGISCSLEIGSDKWLDVMNENKLEDYLYISKI